MAMAGKLASMTKVGIASMTGGFFMPGNQGTEGIFMIGHFYRNEW